MNNVKIRLTYIKEQSEDLNMKEFIEYNKEREVELVESESHEFSEYFSIEVYTNDELEGEGMCPYRSTEEQQQEA